MNHFWYRGSKNVKNSIILCQKEGLLESVQKIVTSAKLKRKKEIRKLEIPIKKQKKSEEKQAQQNITSKVFSEKVALNQ